jgi:hypothetical protein
VWALPAIAAARGNAQAAVHTSAACQPTQSIVAPPCAAAAHEDPSPLRPDPEWLLIDIIETAQTSCAVSEAVLPGDMCKRKVAIFYMEDTPVAIAGKDREHAVAKGMYEGRVVEVRCVSLPC